MTRTEDAGTPALSATARWNLCTSKVLEVTPSPVRDRVDCTVEIRTGVVDGNGVREGLRDTDAGRDVAEPVLD